MKIEMGESLIYSWLRHVKHCQVVQTNWKCSPQWPLEYEEELQEILSTIIGGFQQYTPFKKNTKLAQVIRQGECDLLGLRMEEGKVKVIAVDVAFHEKGLNYGSRTETVGKIIEKSIRTALCIYGYLNVSEAQVLFAFPKVGATLAGELEYALSLANAALQFFGLHFDFQLMANDDFNNEILQPVLDLSDDVADTSELFLRSYQLTKLFKSTDGGQREKIPVASTIEATGKKTQVKIGTMAKTTLRHLLESGAATPEEVVALQTLEGSRAAFNLGFPLLVPIDSGYARTRYYAEHLVIRGQEYVMTSQWYESMRSKLQAWIDSHSPEGQGE